MNHILGGYVKEPRTVINKFLNYLESNFSKSFEFDENIDNNFFFGYAKEKSKELNRNVKFVDENRLFKSLYYHEIPEILKQKTKDSEFVKYINELQNDFVYIVYENNKAISVFIDKFAREKIYYTTYPPYLFSSSLKFLISLLDKKRFNYIVLSRFLCSGVIIGKESLFLGIKRLDIGEFLRINKEKIQIERYWDLSPSFLEKYPSSINDIHYWIEIVYNSLKKALDFPEKKPILSLMSGGLDSTVITSILAKEFNLPIEALTIVVPNYNDEEGEKASEIAKFLNIKHTIKKTKLETAELLENFYSNVFKIVEEPMGGTAFFSRYFAFSEIENINNQSVMTGDGAGEIFTYVRDFVLKNFKKINYMYYIPIFLRMRLMRLFHDIYRHSLKLSSYIKDKNTINSLEILMNSNFLQSKSQFESFFLSWQFNNLEDIFKITGFRNKIESLLAPIRNNIKSYPFKDYNRLGYQFMFNSINSDALIAHNLSNFFDFKLYCPYISDVAFQKLLPLPPYIKTSGNRSKWIVREMAKKKKLLPESYFDWKPKYGLRQLFYTNNSFEIVKNYILDLISSLKEKPILNFKFIENYFRKCKFESLVKHSSEYMKFNIWVGFLGWLSSIEF